MLGNKEDRLSVKLTVTNGAGKVTAATEVNDLSRLDCTVLEEELSEGLTRAIRRQKDKLFLTAAQG